MKGVHIMTTTYNGYRNWETWAAGLWLDNEEPNYRAKLEYFRACHRAGQLPSYTELLRHTGYLANLDVSWLNSRISRRELTGDLRAEYAEWLEYNS